MADSLNVGSGPTVILGGSGQLGSDLQAVWAEAWPGEQLIALSHQDADVTDRNRLREHLAAIQPAAVINLAAFHRVDDIEDNPQPAFLVNAVGAANVAAVCRELDADVLYVSTDYVFPGDIPSPRVETDPVGPISSYGISKLAGEQLTQVVWRKHFIVRSCGLYGRAGSAGKGGNFVETMLRLAREGSEIRVVDDQVVTPTATRPLAVQIAALLRTRAYGTYHATCLGECTWYGFAAEIFRQAGLAPDVHPQTSAEAGARARRPAYSVLENSGLQRLGIDVMPDWQEALSDYLQSRT